MMYAFKFCLLSSVCFSLSGSLLQAGPVLTVSPETFDAGTLPETAKKILFEFSLKNSGDEKLEITNVRAMCGACTKLSLKKKALLPGEKTLLTGELTFPPREGLVNRKIVVQSNDPEAPSRLLAIKGRLRSKREPAHRLASNGGVTVQRTPAGYRASVMIPNRSDQVLEITRIIAPAGWLCKVKLPAQIQPNGRLTAELLQDPDISETKLAGGLVVVKTDDDRMPNINLKLVLPKH